MTVHAMTVIDRATQCVNPGQTPGIEMGQPLYAIANEIQWHSPSK